MTLSEFKAWFEGFTESLDEPPNAKQWKRIKARVAEISGSPTNYPVVSDRYRDYYRPFWLSGTPYMHDVTCQSSADASGQLRNGVAIATDQSGAFGIHAAMFAAGKAEAAH